MESEKTRVVYDLEPAEVLDTDLSGRSDRAQVKPMKYSQIPRAIRSIELATAPDPVSEYIDMTPDASKSRIPTHLRRIKLGLRLAVEICCRRMFTVDQGDAVVQLNPPGPDDILHKTLTAALSKFPRIRSPEQLKREQEFVGKSYSALRATLGDRFEDIFSVESLATTPEKQGKGYGTMLVAKITDTADAQGSATWLGSSNVANTGFYEQCGFTTIAEFTLGEVNPTWTKPPVVVRIMLREFRGLDSLNEKAGWD